MSSQDNKSNSENKALNRRNMLLAGTTLAAASALGSRPQAFRKAVAQAVQQAAPSGKPNILVIMGDDVGWFNIGAYHRGIMSGKTPNLDQLAAQGMMFTDYYAEASCTAGRANFITGQIPLRTGLTTVGQAGADVGMPDQSVTTALILKSMGYATGQFGKNHLGDLNKYLPTLHGFDEYSSVICITSMRCPIRTGSIIRRTGSTNTGRATWCIATRPTPTIPR